MVFSANAIDLANEQSQCVVVGVFEGKRPELTSSGQVLNKATGSQLKEILAQGDFKAEPGATLMVYQPRGIEAKRILLLGLGCHDELSDLNLRKASAAAAKLLESCNIRSAEFAVLDTTANNDCTRQARNIVEAIEETAYQYQETKSIKPRRRSLSKIRLIASRDKLPTIRAGIKQGVAISNGVAFAKTISNLPGNICTPRYLAKQAKRLQKSHGLKTTVLDEKQMEDLKMGALLSVSRGSREPARLIVMEYSGGANDQPPVVLVGKGLTFDAGGISIKPAAAMDEMKYDMCGGASVYGALIAASELKLPLNVVGIVPSSENLPDGAANKPGDIVTSMAGKTIEILNTDAEGRLILCDALTYAERYEPAAVVDIATLTGACIIALGHHASGLFSNSEDLASELLLAGQSSGDRAWRLPTWNDYTKQLKSNFADLANIGGRSAGSVTAACFLQEFTKNYEWAHLDVAGTAWKSGQAKMATGRPVPLLSEFLIGRSGTD